MDEYRIYRTQDIPTVQTSRPFVTMKLDPDDVLRCIGTGSSPQEIAASTYRGRLGATRLDERGTEYTELFSGDLPQ